MTHDPLDPTLSDADVYKAWHDSLRDPAGQSTNSHSTGYEIAINNTVANLFWSAARQMKAFNGTSFSSEHVAVDHAGSGATSGNAFLQEAIDAAHGVWTSSDQHLHERLMVQCQIDADEFRKDIVGVRDPNKPRVVTYKEGEELWATIVAACKGISPS